MSRIKNRRKNQNIMNNEKSKYTIMIVPTGVGASIGGYAGDASRYAQMIAKKTPLIVNPNIVNAAVFSGITENMLYVEGHSIEQLMKGKIGLKPSKNNKIGIIFDKAIPENIFNVHINTLNAVKTVYDINLVGWEITDEDVGVDFYNNEKGISVGRVNNPETMKRAGQKLLKNGADVIAVVCFFEEPPEDDYESGDGVDIVGGVEGIISHYLSKELKCPCVHAPAFEDIVITDKKVDPKVSAEYITPTFLPCLLFGLKNAPLTLCKNDTKYNSETIITKKNIESVIAPFNALGLSVVLDALKSNIPVYAIKENKSVLNVTGKALKKKAIIELERYEDYIQTVLKG